MCFIVFPFAIEVIESLDRPDNISKLLNLLEKTRVIGSGL